MNDKNLIETSTGRTCVNAIPLYNNRKGIKVISTTHPSLANWLNINVDSLNKLKYT